MDFVQRTMLHGELQKQIIQEQSCLEKAKEQYDKQNTVCDNLRTERSIIDEYVELIHEDSCGIIKKMSGKQRKERIEKSQI